MYEEIKEEQQDIEDYNTVELNVDPDATKQEDYPNLSIKIDQAQFSIFELKRRYDRNSICIDPDFQRNAVWNIRQKSELIESVIMGIPLPLIYLAENKDGKLIVVDGRQRLSTFFDFLENEFKLKNLKILPQLNGLTMSDMENDNRFRRYAMLIEDTQLVVQIIKYPTKDRVRFDIFDRVNRGGTPLNKQEMRNALYQGKATKLLNKLAESKEFQNATGEAISPKHMKDKYIILRAICFYLLKNNMLLDEKGKHMVYKSDMEELLGVGMDFINHMTEEQIVRLEKVFKRTMIIAYNCGGPDGFRIPSDKTRKRPISMTLFETIFYYVTLFDKNVSQDTIEDGIKELLKDEEYLYCLQNSVDSSINVNMRFNKVINKYKEKIHV